jgi:hypothetical protein
MHVLCAVRCGLTGRIESWESLQKKKLPKALQLPIEEYCHELWTNRSGLDVGSLFQDVPPTMRIHLANYLYGGTVEIALLYRIGKAAHNFCII